MLPVRAIAKNIEFVSLFATRHLALASTAASRPCRTHRKNIYLFFKALNPAHLTKTVARGPQPPLTFGKAAVSQAKIALLFVDSRGERCIMQPI
ncbi:hypothetical protein A1507_06945 [Methylomonas koyamae]|uniref:Uncharacterized protein n=1 Tax=Methylomonas koyamae TaxID=702114 RepID=A0A177NN70_9GAMM|nr:hypothetical protein A1507_06945 [Methylomonas koyamae]